jgi:DNA polymerase elongation subunit (family B)
MSKYYTNITVYGPHILYRGVKNGRRIKEKINYAPTLFLPAKKKTDYKTLFGEYLEPMQFANIREARDFVKRYESVENFKVYGNDRYAYAFIADTHKGLIDWKMDDLSIVIIDIEVGSENGFPDPYKTTEPITAIAVRQLNGGTTVYGCGHYDNNDENVNYVRCQDEIDLCKKFLNDWQHNYPDVVTGWNTEGFDIPYLINRFTKLFGDKEARKLSPWEVINERVYNFKGSERKSYDIFGIAQLDYIELYKWYAPNGKSQDSYKLDNIASVELGENKLSYDEYDTLHQLYKLNYQKFIEYNIKDVELILKLEEKLKLIQLALTMAYDTKCNYSDVFAQTRMWDALIYNHLLDQKIIVPPKEVSHKGEAFEGAYVKEPQVGNHDWVASFDLNSLYPHLIQMYNISPETLIPVSEQTEEMRKVIHDGVTVDKLLEMKVDTSKISDVILTPNGQYFRKDVQGFLPKMMEEMYEDRKKFKKLMLKAEQEYENETDVAKKKELENLIARYNNLQLAKKLSLNSAYGALGSQYFRFFDLRMALAVTMSGQLSIQWIESKLNTYMNDILKTKKDYVIASDTDSIYLNLGPLVRKVYKEETDPNKVITFMDRVCEDKIQPYINKSYQELADYIHAYAQKMQMKREALASKGIWTAKKRYILNVYNNEGVQYAEPQMKVKGLEMIKSSTPYAIREKMKEMVKLVMNGTETDVQDFIAKFREDFKKLPVEDISFPRGVNNLAEYRDSTGIYKKGTPIHVKGALIYNHYLKQKNLTNSYPLIQEGEKLKFTYLKEPNPMKDTVISFPTRLPKEFDLQKYIDYNIQFEKAFIEPVSVILNCMGWSSEKNNSLESFF